MSNVTEIGHELMKDVYETQDKFERIAGNIDTLKKAVIQLSEEENMISKIRDEIAVIINGLSEISEKNATNSEEVCATTQEQLANLNEMTIISEKLAESASELNSMIQKFKV